MKYRYYLLIAATALLAACTSSEKPVDLTGKSNKSAYK